MQVSVVQFRPWAPKTKNCRFVSVTYASILSHRRSPGYNHHRIQVRYNHIRGRCSGTHHLVGDVARGGMCFVQGISAEIAKMSEANT
jgi:hypothetical protein